MRVRDGSRCLLLYIWNFPPRWQDPHLIELVLLFREEVRTQHRSYPITYYPFHYKDLVLRLRGAGFHEVQSDFDDAKDTYTVIARLDNNRSRERGLSARVPESATSTPLRSSDAWLSWLDQETCQFPLEFRVSASRDSLLCEQLSRDAWMLTPRGRGSGVRAGGR